MSSHYHDDCGSLDIYFFNNIVVTCPSSKYKCVDDQFKWFCGACGISCMIMYDFITRKTKEIKHNFEGPAVSCSNKKNIYVISRRRKIWEVTFSFRSSQKFIKKRKLVCLVKL